MRQVSAQTDQLVARQVWGRTHADQHAAASARDRSRARCGELCLTEQGAISRAQRVDRAGRRGQ